MDLSLLRWKSLSDSERESAAKRLISALPSGFKVDSLVGKNAFFAFQDTRFVLVPGGEVNLGFDPDCGWSPTPEEAESWRETAQELGLPESVKEYVSAVTLRPRKVQISTLLVEASPWELGWTNIKSDDDEVQWLLKKYPNGVQLCRDGLTKRVQKH